MKAQKALGAKEMFHFPGPGGKIAHCEIQVGDSRIMLADESSDWGTYSRSSGSMIIHQQPGDLLLLRSRSLDWRARLHFLTSALTNDAGM